MKLKHLFFPFLFIGLFAIYILFELMMKNKIGQVHSYKEEDFTTFEPKFSSNITDKSATKTDDKQIKFNQPKSHFFENLINSDIKNSKVNTPKNKVDPEIF